jgi:hypothetical protein
MHRMFNTNVLGTILATLSWILIAWIVYLLIRALTSASGWPYLD